MTSLVDCGNADELVCDPVFSDNDIFFVAGPKSSLSVLVANGFHLSTWDHMRLTNEMLFCSSHTL